MRALFCRRDCLCNRVAGKWFGACVRIRENRNYPSCLFPGGSAAAAAKSLQSCPTLCDPIDGSPPGSPVPGILQARTLEWVAISFPNAWEWKVKVKSLSRVRPSATPWTAAFQAPPSMGFSLVIQTITNLPAMRETWVHSLAWEDPLEKAMATHSSVLGFSRESPWTEEPGRLLSTGSQRVGHDWVTKITAHHLASELWGAVGRVRWWWEHKLIIWWIME